MTPTPPSLAATRATGDLADADLVARVRAGDDRAFEQLYERYHRRIAAYIYGMVGDYGRAEDIAQDVFLSALRRARASDQPIAFKPWVYEIAKNACIDQFRRSRRRDEVSLHAEDDLGGPDRVHLTSTGHSPHAAVDQKLTLDHLRGAFGGLSETHHQILVMRELEGLSYREIGERLGMSRPSVESTLFRARRRLTEEYDELVSGARCLRVQSIITGAVDAPPGARDQRRMAAHVSHCQVCRRVAHGAGLDVAAMAQSRTRARIAALLPLPAFLRRRVGGGDVAAHPGHGSLAHWSAQVSGSVDPAMATWGKAAAAAATIAIAGVGVGAGSRSVVHDFGRGTSVPATQAPSRQSAARPSAPSAPSPTAASVQAAFAGAMRNQHAPEHVRAAGVTSTRAAGSAGLAPAATPTTPPTGTTSVTATTSTAKSPTGLVNRLTGPTAAPAPAVPAQSTPNLPVVPVPPVTVPPVHAPSLPAITGAITGSGGQTAGDGKDGITGIVHAP